MKNSRASKLHLSISAIILIAVGLAYGFYPHKVIPSLFDLELDTTDLKNVFRAVMGLYWAMAIYWMVGVFFQNHWRGATISCTVLMGGLAFGRIVSWIAEGAPSTPFVIGLILELLSMFWGVYNLKKEYRRQF